MCFDYHENEEQKRREARQREQREQARRDQEARAQRERDQAEAARVEQERLNDPSNKLPTDLKRWGAKTTARIYKAIGAKGDKLSPTLAGEFDVDGFKIRVKRKTGRGGVSRVFLVAGKRLIPVGRVFQASFTPNELAKLGATK